MSMAKGKMEGQKSKGRRSELGHGLVCSKDKMPRWRGTQKMLEGDKTGKSLADVVCLYATDTHIQPQGYDQEK